MTTEEAKEIRCFDGPNRVRFFELPDGDLEMRLVILEYDTFSGVAATVVSALNRLAEEQAAEPKKGLIEFNRKCREAMGIPPHEENADAIRN